MKLTTTLIDALIDYEAHLHYSPHSIDEARDVAMDLLLESSLSPFAATILYFEDAKQYDECGRIVRAILDTYAPRRSVLDFIGKHGEAGA